MVKFPGGIEAKAVIFDFDGVIVDTEPLHYRAFQRILEPMGLGFSWQEYVDTYMGFDDRDAFIEAFASRGRQLGHGELSGLIERKAGLFQEVIRDGVTPYPGVVELITALHDAAIPLAICSGALYSDITPVLEMLALSDCFDVMVTADEVARSKPDPECYRLAFSKLRDLLPHAGLSTGLTIAVEDTPAGITSATGAGMRVIAVTNSYPREHLADATSIVESLDSLRGFQLA